LVALEASEVLRPGFLELLKPDGVVVLNRQRIVPQNTDPADYPLLDAVRQQVGTRRIVELDALQEACAIGDEEGRAANVIALGVLSTLPPLSSIPPSVWRKAIVRTSPREEIQRGNVAAFEQGRRVTGRGAP
jgi:indolepyruvate ferredoxin oxidoreductase alpha subunit